VSNTLSAIHGVSLEEASRMKFSYVPQHRDIDPDEIAFAGLFLASTMASGVSANEMFIDTGMTHCTKPGLCMKIPDVSR
jgi:3-hydroxybutyrate dehydrogenase